MCAKQISKRVQKQEKVWRKAFIRLVNAKAAFCLFVGGTTLRLYLLLSWSIYHTWGQLAGVTATLIASRQLTVPRYDKYSKIK